jgi:nucleotide-binding universal stress UspA family protein
MTIGPKADLSAPSTTAELRTILFATDFGKGSTKALPLVLELARQHHSKLILLHMISPMPVTSTNLSTYVPATVAADELQEWLASSRSRSVQQLKEWMPRDTGLTQEPEYIVGTDFSPEGILTAAANIKADLIVMGANHKGSARIAAHVPWTTVHEVVRNAPCPVLTVAG